MIEVNNLTFSYGDNTILKELNLKINDGDFAAIIGNNGAGKSTLIKLLVHELEAAKGEILIDKKNINDFKSWDRIGYVNQVDRNNPIAFPISCSELVVLNLYEDFNFFNRPKKEHWQRVKESLEVVQMLDYYDRDFNSLSGGQKQRIMIAKALVHRPDILIFDEPTVGVDQDNSRAFFQLLKHLNERHGKTIIMVTHELDKADGYFNKKFYLENKTIREEIVC